MNNLSWMLYFASVLDGVGGIIAAVGIISILLFGVVGFLGIVSTDGECLKEKWYSRSVAGLAVLAFVAGIVASLIPDKQTVYLIAASEMGQQAIQTPEFVKLRGVVNHYLDEAVGDNKENK